MLKHGYVLFVITMIFGCGSRIIHIGTADDSNCGGPKETAVFGTDLNIQKLDILIESDSAYGETIPSNLPWYSLTAVMGGCFC